MHLPEMHGMRRVNLKSKVIPKCFWELVWDNIIVENNRWMNITFYLPTKYKFLNLQSLFINIWIETHIPLKSQIADFSKIII